MATVGDFFVLMGKVQVVSDAFGTTPKFREEYIRRIESIGKSIASENSVEWGTLQCMEIADVVPLGPESARRFDSLRRWLQPKHPVFKAV